MEKTGLTSSKYGKEIRVSTTARLYYRNIINPERYKLMKNEILNKIIAKEYLKQPTLHYFKLGYGSKGTPHRGTAEISGSGSRIYISAIRESYIDILTLQDKWFEVRYKGSALDPIELGDV